jgi:hypothetical protein
LGTVTIPQQEEEDIPTVVVKHASILVLQEEEEEASLQMVAQALRVDAKIINRRPAATNLEDLLASCVFQRHNI